VKAGTPLFLCSPLPVFVGFGSLSEDEDQMRREDTRSFADREDIKVSLELSFGADRKRDAPLVPLVN